MQRIRDAEGGIALVRELGIGYNPHVGRHAILGDVNAYERQLGVHLSIGKKHGIFGKKLPKTDIQKYHIDIFLEVRSLHLDEAVVAFDSKKILVQTS
jgi:aminopeptidase